MPKMKTHSASKKRLRKNGNGKFKRSKAFKRHHAWAKTADQSRKSRRKAFLSGGNEANAKILMPY
jgi:large subunit ribosomal protein L35